MTDLKGAITFVTGAARGIGHGLALDLAARGSLVAAFDVDTTGLQRTVAAIEGSGGRAVAKPLDVRDSKGVIGAFDEAAAELGGLDILVAGAGAISFGRILDLDVDEWRRVMDVNATGVFLCLKAASRLMVAGGKGGSIVAISSVAGKEGEVGLGHYCASKFAVLGLVQTLAKELAEYDVTVNAVCPGTVMTPMIDQLSAASGEDALTFVDRQLIKRPQTPAEIGEAVAFLYGSRSITGQAINIDGGTVFH